MKNKKLSALRFSILLSLCLCVSAVNLSCSSTPIDPRSVIPADALVYLETRDLGKTIGSVSESAAFAKISKTKPNLAAVNGVKMSVAVTGFETSEKSVNAESSVLNFQPRFVAVVETNAWSWQAASFVENTLGEFINDAYGGGVELTVSPKDGGNYYVWTSQDGRKAYAMLLGSLVFFGNDESSIDKCLAVRRGEADSIAKNPKVTNGDRLAFGYISPDGIAQIANIQAVSLAMETGEDAELKSFVARVLPELLRSSLKEMTWTANQVAEGIEDKYEVSLNPEVIRVLNDTMAAAATNANDLSSFIPSDAGMVTRYDLADAQLAWRSILLTARAQTDAVSGKLLAAFSGSLFEPYAIENAELFLRSVEGSMATVKLDADSDDVAVIASIKNVADVKKSIAKEISFAKPPEKIGDVDVWRSADGDLAAAFAGHIAIIGDAAIVQKCIAANAGGPNMSKSAKFKRADGAAWTSLTADLETPATVGVVLGQPTGEKARQTIVAATQFNQGGMRRTVRSDFGLIGTLMAQFAPENASARN